MTEFTCKVVEDKDELKGAMDVRRQVFVLEQGISKELVYDRLDSEAIHFIVKEEGRVVGTARARLLEGNEAKLERMAILARFRHLGIGRNMMRFITEELKERQTRKIVLHAQYQVMEFYKGCGFITVGSPFWEAGIKHIRMEREF